MKTGKLSEVKCGKGCGNPVHAGPCDKPHTPSTMAYRISRWPSGDYVVKLGEAVKASGFDSEAEAQQWIDEK